MDKEDDQEDDSDNESDSSDESHVEFDRDDEKTLADMVLDMRKKALEKKKQQKKKAKLRKKNKETTGAHVDKMKFMLPFLEALMIKKNMRGLLMNYAVDQAYKNGETVKVRQGTKVREVTERRLLAERLVYQNNPLNDEDGVAKLIDNMKFKRGDTQPRERRNRDRQ